MRATDRRMGWASSRQAKYGIAAVAIVALAAALLLAMGRSPICPCGTVKLWHGVVQSDENSQQIGDWYALSHINHGLLFFAAGWMPLRRVPVRIRFLIATVIEAAWEILENSPIIIDRYRAVTMTFGYSGDSVLNSVSDIGMMMIGFWIAWKLPALASIILLTALELVALTAIRDNLTLNAWMLIAPNAAIRDWQTG